jgi:hypothetical protein
MTTSKKVLFWALGLCTAIPLYSRVAARPPTGLDLVTNDPGSRLVADAKRAERSGVLIETSGIVEEIGAGTAADSGSEQRLLVRLTADLSVPVMHNVRATPRVPASVGDRVRVRGWYQWNEQGGAILGWHTDAAGARREGWILHEGRFYASTDELDEVAGMARTRRTAD